MKHLLLIVVLSATVMLTGLGAHRLWDDDEPRNAGCAREMLARGDWIVPTFNAELRAHKPVLTYWCIMTSFVLLGESEFSARLPSALAAIGTTLLTYAIGRRLFSKEAALWAALILPSTMLFVMAGRIATPDSLLIFTVTLTMAVYVWTAWPVREVDAVENHETHESELETTKYVPRRWWLAATIYAAMGLAVLAKGPVGIVLPTAILGIFLLIVRWPSERRVGPDRLGGRRPTGMDSGSWWAGAALRLLGPPYDAMKHFLDTARSMRPLTALAMVALVAGPWYLAVGQQTDWKFLEEFFIKHNVERATGAMEGHRGGIWFYPVMLLVGFFPWSIFAIPLALDVFAVRKQRGREATATLFLLCWIGVWLGAFTLARTKLPSYATPCFPAVALLTGRFIERLLGGRLALARYWPAISFACLTAVGLGAAIALPLAAHRYLPGDEWLGILGVAPLIGGLAGLALWRLHRPAIAATGLVLSGAAMMLGVFWIGAHAVDKHQHADGLLAVIRQSSERPEVASFKILEPSWVYYGQLPIREIHGPADAAAAFLAASPDRYLITTERHWRRCSDQGLPPDVVILARVDHFLRDERLVLVGRPSAGLAGNATRQGDHRHH